VCMITPELLNYIQLRIAKGHHLDIIRKDLFAYGGWSHDDIEEAFTSIGVSEQDIPASSVAILDTKTGENKDEIISQNTYPEQQPENIEPSMHMDLGGDISVSSRKEDIIMSEDVSLQKTEDDTSILDLDTKDLTDAGIETTIPAQETEPQSVEEKPITIQDDMKEIAGMSFEQPQQENQESPIVESKPEKSNIQLPPVQPVESFDPRITPAPILVKDDIVSEPVSFVSEPKLTPDQSIKNQDANGSPAPSPVMPESGNTITGMGAGAPILNQKPTPTAFTEKNWYTKSEPMTPVMYDNVSGEKKEVPAFGDMAITPETQVYDDGVIIKKKNPIKTIIIVILIILLLIGGGFYVYSQGLLGSLFHDNQKIETPEEPVIPSSDNIMTSLRNAFPVGSGLSFSYVGSITSPRDLISILVGQENQDEEIMANESLMDTDTQEENTMITDEEMNTDIVADDVISIESLISVDGWLRMHDTGIQSEGNIILETPHGDMMNRIRASFVLDNQFAYILFQESPAEFLETINIDSDVWYRIPIIHTETEDEETLPHSVQLVSRIIKTIASNIGAFVIQDGGTQSMAGGFPVYQYPLSVISDNNLTTFVGLPGYGFMHIIQNIRGFLSLRQDSLYPILFSGSSSGDDLDIQHTLQFSNVLPNQNTARIPESFEILFEDLDMDINDEDEESVANNVIAE
jgi:hypothetical protein